MKSSEQPKKSSNMDALAIVGVLVLTFAMICFAADFNMRINKLESQLPPEPVCHNETLCTGHLRLNSPQDIPHCMFKEEGTSCTINCDMICVYECTKEVCE